MGYRIPLFIIFIFIFCTISPPINSASDGEITILLNKNASEKNLTNEDINKIYTGYKLSWNNNRLIKLTVMADPDLHKKFLRKYVKRSPGQFRRTWKRMLLLGKGVPPIRFRSTNDLITYISSNENAIGYVYKEFDITDPNVIKIKTELRGEKQ